MGKTRKYYLLKTALNIPKNFQMIILLTLTHMANTSLILCP